MDVNKRPDWDQYFLNLLQPLGSRVTCNRGKCAAIFVRDNRILVTGYAGAPPGLPHCIDNDDQLEESYRFLTKYDAKLDDLSTITVEGLTYEWNELSKRYETKKKISCVRTCHSEENCIITASHHGISLENSTLYVSMTPCSKCCKLIIGAGAKKVICLKKYHSGQESEYMFKLAGIELIHIEDTVQLYGKDFV